MNFNSQRFKKSEVRIVDVDAVAKMQESTCAVVRVTTKSDKPPAHAAEHGQPGPLDECEFVGTAFLVERGVVVTNRHVVDLIMTDHTHGQSVDDWFVRFTSPRDEAAFAHTFFRIENVSPIFLDGHNVLNAGHLTTDVGIVSFDYGSEDSDRFSPVEFGKLRDIHVGACVANCGFPFGSESRCILPAGRLSGGPRIHQGKIWGLTPYDRQQDARSIELILTDLNTADGLIGSPVLLQEQGRVVGIHCGKINGTLAAAIPVDRDRVASWVRYHEIAMQDPEATIPMLINRGGDIVIGRYANEPAATVVHPSTIAVHDTVLERPFGGTKAPA